MKKNRAGFLWIGLALSLVSGCEGCDLTPVQSLRAVPTVKPTVLDYGVVDVTQPVKLSFTIGNTGDGEFRDINVSLSPETDPAFTLGKFPTIVKSGQNVAVDVHLLPVVASSLTGKVIIRGRVGADDDPPTHADFTVDLRAVAENRGLPDIAVDPVEADFGKIGQGDVKRLALTIRNVGIRDLLLTEVNLEAPTDSPFRCITCPVPTNHILRPQDAFTVDLAFNPTDVLDHEATLHILSNDPDEREVLVPLRGGGQVAPSCIVDLLDDVTALEPQTTVRLDGSRSSTPVQGEYIQGYEWDLYRPAGSVTVVESQGPDQGAGLTLAVDCPDPATNPASPCSGRVDVLADIAGTYVLTLVVVDSLGVRSPPCTADFRAIPKEQLHVQLVWDHPTADMDLHFQLNTGPTFNHGTDCYFSNRFPIWFGCCSAVPPRNPGC